MTIIDVVYGMEGDKNQDMLTIAEELLTILGLVLIPGSYLVESLPAREFFLVVRRKY